MPVSKFRPGSNGDHDPDYVVEANRSDPEEESLIDEGVDEITDGERIIADAVHLEKTEDILRRRGYRAAAERLHATVQEMGQTGHQSIQHGVDKIERADDLHRARIVADLVRNEPQQLVSWQAAIKTITRTIERSVPEEIFITAAGGDTEAGRQRRAETLHLGEWLSQLQSDAVQTAEEALRIGLSIVSFVADVETIYDNLPEPIKHIIGAALKTLLALFR